MDELKLMMEHDEFHEKMRRIWGAQAEVQRQVMEACVRDAAERRARDEATARFLKERALCGRG